eukprot:gene47331-biopygen97864
MQLQIRCRTVAPLPTASPTPLPTASPTPLTCVHGVLFMSLTTGRCDDAANNAVAITSTAMCERAAGIASGTLGSNITQARFAHGCISSDRVGGPKLNIRPDSLRDCGHISSVCHCRCVRGPSSSHVVAPVPATAATLPPTSSPACTFSGRIYADYDGDYGFAQYRFDNDLAACQSKCCEITNS